MSARVCFVVGARPNFMKSAPVHRELAARDPSLELVLVHTGQHYDDAMSDVFFRELGLPRADEFLGVGRERMPSRPRRLSSASSGCSASARSTSASSRATSTRRSRARWRR